MDNEPTACGAPMVQAKHIAHAHVLEGKRFAQIGVPLLVVLVKVEPCAKKLEVRIAAGVESHKETAHGLFVGRCYYFQAVKGGFNLLGKDLSLLVAL